VTVATTADAEEDCCVQGCVPNDQLRRARLRLPSPVVPGRRMSRQELAEAVNAYVYTVTGRRSRLDAGYIGKLERGIHRWPRADHRRALRAVLGAATDAEVGLYNMRRSASDEAFLASDPTLASPAPVNHRQVAGVASAGGRNHRHAVRRDP
jgi:transcriptional regulator with XRE-family HTH domain